MEDGTSKDWSPERAREVEALMRLQCLPGVGTRTLWRILERFGSGVAALEAPAAQLRAVGARSAAADLGAPQLDDRLRGALARCARSDIDVLTWRDPGYPARLRQLADPPALLFCRGDPALLLKSSVTVVGSRRSTPYGRRVAETLAAELSVRGVVVVSGLALGIDGAAHRGCPGVGGRYDRRPRFRGRSDSAILAPRAGSEDLPRGASGVRVPSRRARSSSSLPAEESHPRGARRRRSGGGGRRTERCVHHRRTRLGPGSRRVRGAWTGGFPAESRVQRPATARCLSRVLRTRLRA